MKRGAAQCTVGCSATQPSTPGSCRTLGWGEEGQPDQCRHPYARGAPRSGRDSCISKAGYREAEGVGKAPNPAEVGSPAVSTRIEGAHQGLRITCKLEREGIKKPGYRAVRGDTNVYAVPGKEAHGVGNHALEVDYRLRRKRSLPNRMPQRRSSDPFRCHVARTARKAR